MAKTHSHWSSFNPRRLTVVARRVVRDFGIEDVVLHPIGASENHVWRVSRPKGSFLLRCHRPACLDTASLPAMSRVKIECELAWLSYLRERASFLVPSPFYSPGGLGVFTTRWDESTDLHWSMLHWLPGRLLRRGLRLKHLHLVGRMMGEMHSLKDETFAGRLKRPQWDKERMLGALSEMDHLRRAAIPDVILWDVLLWIRDHVAQLMDELGHGPDAYGLIHADLHPGNILFAGNRVSPIDFSSCGFGFYAFDIAQMLLMAPNDDYWDAFSLGYLETVPRASERLAHARVFTGFSFILWLNYNAQTRFERIAPRLNLVTRRVVSLMELDGLALRALSSSPFS